MATSIGTRLGPYEVRSRLGAGGMGEVYRARDAKLARDVAIKVLPSDLAADAGRLKRFEKEARSASALNHPNIVTIYEIGSADSVSYIAMELVEGKTLRELLFPGPLPIKRLLHLAAQIADGLARAHEAGIVHRDLKPENVMVTKDGRVKILDFGLAKLTPALDSAEGTNIPTETGTGAGVILGTVGYMSPEQASGQPVDFRSDQFSFGSILYELVTGKRAFHKKTGVETLSAIIQAEPAPIGAVNSEVPAPLRWVVERCLAKDPDERYGTTQDLARDLATLRDHLTEAVGVQAQPKAARRPRRALAMALVAAALVAAGVLTGRRLWKEPLPLAPTFKPLTFRRGSVFSAKFSPDGNTIVYTASWSGEPPQLYSSRPESRESLVLPFPGAEVAAISPSGEMALLKDGVLSRAALAGGAAREVLANVGGADWSPDGSKFAVVHNVSGRSRIEYPIGKVLYEAPPAGGIHDIRVSPGGDRIAFIDSPSFELLGSLAVVDLQGRKTTLSKGWGFLHGLNWSPAGDEVWFVGGLRQDAMRGELRAVSLAGRERVILRSPGRFGLFDITRDGRGLGTTSFCASSISGVVPGESAERDLSWFDFSVVQDLSADGRTMLFTEGLEERGASEGNAVYIRKLDGSPAVRIGEGGAYRLSPDGRWVIASVGVATPRLTLIPTGAGETRTLERGSIEQYTWGAGWFPDGKRIWFNGREPGRGIRCYVQSVDGGAPRPFLPEGFRGRLVSPDGKLIAAVDISGPKKIVFFSAEGQPIALPHDLPPGTEPSVFSTDSRFLFAFGYGQIPTPVYRLDLASGKKQLWKELAPTDRSGLEGMSIVRLSADGRSYAYCYSRCLNDLYLVEGLKR